MDYIDELVFSELHQGIRSLTYLFEQLDDSGTEELFKPMTPKMRIRIDSDLSKMRYYIPYNSNEDNGNVVNNPLLLWQGSTDLCEMWRSNDWNENKCELSFLPNYKTSNPPPKLGISEIFSWHNFVVEIDGIEIFFNQIFEWPPSIDSLFFVETLDNHFADNLCNVKNVWDVGCGTGIIGVSIAKKYQNVELLLLSDLDRKKGLLSKWNANYNLRQRLTQQTIRYKFMTGEGLSCNEQNRRYDLLVCAPPYLPERDISSYNWNRSSDEWHNSIRRCSAEWFST